MTRPDNVDAGDNEDVRRVSSEFAGRLSRLGIRLSGTERAEDLAALVEAIERFETVVEARGGDLMMDEGPRGASTPDDPHFALPMRGGHESVADYLERLARKTDEVRRHPPRAD